MSYTIVEGMTGSELFPGSNAWSCMASLAELSDPAKLTFINYQKLLTTKIWFIFTRDYYSCIYKHVETKFLFAF